MEQDGKLVVCDGLNGQQLKFTILKDVILGAGAFGTVTKAYEQSRQYQQLACKIIPYGGDETTKNKIKAEVDVMKQLGEHPNIVKVEKLKCFSQNNFYIFMEYCNEGTLERLMKQKVQNKENFTDQEIFEIFYQIMSGYKVLWEKGILHQDLKPDNILIKNGVYKITDFGFSIFHQGVTFTKQRQGTFPYMPLQKLTIPNLKASTKSDVFALGVIFFKMIVGRHPYVLSPSQNYKDYTSQFQAAELSVPSYIRARMSPPMNHLFELILKMVAKKQRDRIDFEEAYNFIAEEQAFLELKAQNNSSLQTSLHSQEITLPKPIAVRFVEVSRAVMIPFQVSFADENQYQKKLRDKTLVLQQRRKIEICYKLQRYLFSMRLIVYFFDRVSRKLIVQNMVKLKNSEYNQDGQAEQKAVLCLLYLATKITSQTLQQSRYARIFLPDEWKVYKETNPRILIQIRRDEQYLKQIRNQVLSQTVQSKIKDRNSIIESSKLDLQIFMNTEVKKIILELLLTKTSLIDPKDRKLLTTISYLLSALDIIQNFKKKNEQWEQLQGFFRQIEVQNLQYLFQKVTKGLDALQIDYSIDYGEYNLQEDRQA